MNQDPPQPINEQAAGRFFDHRVVVVTGTATGMGAAVADALASTAAVVHTIDVADQKPRRAEHWLDHRCDLSDRHAIDEAVNQLPDHVDVLLNCAGVPNGGRFTPEQIMAVNWLGLRHLTESTLDRMRPGGNVVHIASTAGRNWPDRPDIMTDLMAATSFDDGARWVAETPTEVADGYVLSKEAVQYYTMWRAAQLIDRQIRMNSVCPGVTDTALVADFRRGIGDSIIDDAVAVAGRMGTPQEMAAAVLFLADGSQAGYITGVNLNVDGGTAAHRQTTG